MCQVKCVLLTKIWYHTHNTNKITPQQLYKSSKWEERYAVCGSHIDTGRGNCILNIIESCFTCQEFLLITAKNAHIAWQIRRERNVNREVHVYCFLVRSFAMHCRIIIVTSFWYIYMLRSGPIWAAINSWLIIIFSRHNGNPLYKYVFFFTFLCLVHGMEYIFWVIVLCIW